MMKRKIIQVHTVKYTLLALCDDGTLWEQDLSQGKIDYIEDAVKKTKYVSPWVQLEDVPEAKKERYETEDEA